MSTRKGAVRTVNKSLIRSRWAAIGAAVAVTLGGGVVMVANAAPTSVAGNQAFTFDTGSVSVYQPIEPCRLLDTRAGNKSATEKYTRGIYFGEIGATGSQGANYLATNNVDVYFDPSDTLTSKTVINNGVTTSIFGDCVDTIDALDPTLVPTAIAVNITVTDIDTPSFVTLYPADVLVADKPEISNITVYPPENQARMNGSIVTLGAAAGSDVDGTDYSGQQAFRIYNEFKKSYVNIVIDVLGFYYNKTVVETLTPGT